MVVEVCDGAVDVGPSSLASSGLLALCAGSCGLANSRFRPGDLSGSNDCSRDIPGRRMLRCVELSESLSLSFRRYAADPRPLSAVCRKNVGSIDPSDFAI